MQANSLPEFFQCLAGRDHGFSKAAAFFHALSSLAEIKHPSREVEAQVTQIVGAAAFENFDGLGDFVRMPGHTAKRLIHVGDKGHHFFAHALARFHHDFREAYGVFFFFHKGAGAHFHVENQGVDAFGKFLAHNGRADEADILDSGSHVTQGVNLFVGRSNFRSLPNQTHTAFAQNPAKLFERQIYVETRNCFQLVERAAGVAQATAADHRNGKAARRNDRSKNEGSLIANPPCGMFVHFLAGNL